MGRNTTSRSRYSTTTPDGLDSIPNTKRRNRSSSIIPTVGAPRRSRRGTSVQPEASGRDGDTPIPVTLGLVDGNIPDDEDEEKEKMIKPEPITTPPRSLSPSNQNLPTNSPHHILAHRPNPFNTTTLSTSLLDTINSHFFSSSTEPSQPSTTSTNTKSSILVTENRRLRLQVQSQTNTISELSQHLEDLEMRNEELENMVRARKGEMERGQELERMVKQLTAEIGEMEGKVRGLEGVVERLKAMVGEAERVLGMEGN
ncbi:hypothetical protein EX30DRAFT_396837 [Ascodesmis nigricans]|uniref:Uncharacterized protein n=1 Tax=Ascodesmis nigricans TaxID=341454 RepID=A0A4S2MTD4_9PEZI|nr:hypothetical protein EX30DRAFT_396837 [Ascodesmis nigricans]